ncbi:MarR family winged helix-turn-helix transcriptional regulator [Prauserella endophytica]|uniref:MarR family transcriptional regulator n=1 Tax=Prauserella endophytica TaxID=1592324 RepID=A0ABY2S7E9_9PSEU|nr:MarR family transcriptional regulator [Prauserella endophytica]TKG71025.1 MarR family transcriptional regulator [Prauserella endophytica]
MHEERTANLLGAAALTVTDLVLAGATGATGVSASGAAALVVLSASPGLSGTELGRRVGLSQSAAARMVDALEGRGLVERRPGQGREVSIRLTRAGRRATGELLAARGTRLAGALAVLDDDERAVLTGLLEKLLTGLYGEVGDAQLLCRLCDRGSCTEGAPCPVGQAERDRDGRS